MERNANDAWGALHRVRLYVLISCSAAFAALLALWAGDFRHHGWRPAGGILVCLVCAFLITLSVDGYRKLKPPALAGTFCGSIVIVALLMAAIGAWIGVGA